MNTVENLKSAATKFYEALKKDPNGRYLSWEHCYFAFYKARQEQVSDDCINFLSLHLSFYLASWGMYRGSSFLLQKDYRIHKPAIKEILLKKYEPLFGIECSEFRELTNQNLLEDINKYLKEFYKKIRGQLKKTSPKSEISNTLITKILMGTLGCVPAYDRYFIDSIKKQKVATGNYNLNSILRLVKFYEDNSNKLEPVRKKMKIDGILYPQMKLLDMGFWQIGFDADVSK